MSSSKIKLFVENFLVYGLGGIISKIIPLIMIPIIIRIMPNSDYYGLSDLSNTLVSFASAFAVMGMYDAMYRMFFEKDDKNYKTNVCSTALIFTIITSTIVFIILLLTKNIIANYFFSDRKYAYLVYLSAIATLVGATNSIISAPTRMQNKRKIFLITNTISPVLSYAVSIPLLLAGYYTIALPISAIVASLTLEITFYIINKEWFSFKYFDINLVKELLIIAIPLFPNFLIYWVFNSCDKVMITNILGIGAAGIYSVASKLGNCSQLIYTAFAGGWQFFAFSTMKEKNQVKNNSLVFEYLGIVSFVVTMFICAWSYSIFKVLFTEEYISGYIIAPYLFLAPLMQMLFQVACNQFVIIKKTWPNMFILNVGALANIIINYYFIPLIGIEGASLATLIGYVLSDIICVIVLYKMELMQLEARFFISFIIIVVYLIAWRLFFNSSMLLGTIIASIISLVYLYFYRSEMIFLISRKK